MAIGMHHRPYNPDVGSSQHLVLHGILIEQVADQMETMKRECSECGEKLKAREAEAKDR